MGIDTLFGPEEIATKPRRIKFKQIKAVYETLTVSCEHIAPLVMAECIQQE